MIQSAKEAKRIVVKVGTSTLAYPTGLLNIQRTERLVKVLSDLKNSGREIILVTSGAIGVGMGKAGLKQRPTDTPGKQACAAIGQCELMYCYDKYFAEYNHAVAQVLLTRDVIDDDARKENVINTFSSLLHYGVVPIINENDTVATEEIEFGDNDTLSAIVGTLVDADLLVIFSDIDGVYDQDPRKNPDAQLLQRIPAITPEIQQLAGNRGSTRGTGGMITKFAAAEIALKGGFPTVITNGCHPERLYDLLEGKSVGTWIG